ncbi:MAG: SspB family protein [Kiloniellaceae bacterium]
MSEQDLRYDQMVEDALRGVVGRALAHAAAHGLPGDHHFYVTFRTAHPDVRISANLRQRYPGEMTIVLQHQYWDLEVEPEFFAVTLSFSDVAERLIIPFSAVVAFADPSVRFGLQFDVGDGAGAVAPDGDEETGEAEQAPAPVADLAALRPDPAPERAAPSDAMPAEGKVVAFDTSRKR